MVGAPISYSGYHPAAAGGAAQPHQMHATPNSPISTLLPYNGLAPHAASFPPSSAPINTAHLYPPNTPSYPPNPPPTSAPANLYPPTFPSYPPSPAQNLPPTGYPPQQQNLHNQAHSGYPFPGQPSGTYPPPSSTTQYYYPPNNSVAQPGVYPSQPAYPGAYPPPQY